MRLLIFLTALLVFLTGLALAFDTAFFLAAFFLVVPLGFRFLLFFLATGFFLDAVFFFFLTFERFCDTLVIAFHIEP